MQKLFPTSAKRARRETSPESGYVLITVIFMAALVLLALAVAAPKMAEDIRRDKEQELMHRGLQYARAVRLYYKKTNSYPNSIDQLEKTNNIRFLRKRYKDPITGKDEWRIIHFGQVKVPQTGLFGAALPGAGGAAAGALSGASGLGGGGGAFNNSGGAFNNSVGTTAGGLGGGSLGSTSTGTGDSSGGATGGATTGTSSSPTGSTAGSSTGTATGSSTGSAFGNGINAASTNQTFGGAGMVGIASTSTKESIKEFKKQKHYNEWEFVYDPRADLGINGQNGTGLAGGAQQPALNGQPIVPPNAPGGGVPGGAANVPQSAPPQQQ